MLDVFDKLPVYLLISEEKKRVFDNKGSDPSVQATFLYQHLFSQKKIMAFILFLFLFFNDASSTQNIELHNKCCCPIYIVIHAQLWLMIMDGILTPS